MKDPDIKQSYSEITDINILTKKLADECTKIVRKHPLARFFGYLDELLETEIKKYLKRVKELEEKQPNIIQILFGGK